MRLLRGGGDTHHMKKKETQKDKAKRLWKAAGLPDFFNRKGPKNTPAWLTYACHLEYTAHAPSWRRAANFMANYHEDSRHWTTWQKAISKWPCWVWDRIDRGGEISRPVQGVIMIDVIKRKFLSWRIRAKARGEKCDVPYLLRKSPCKVEGVLLDKGFDSNPLHSFLREKGIWSIAPVRKGCKRGRYRKELRDFFDWGLYRQRNIVESLISAVKRLFGSHVRARSARMQRAELSSRFIAYNIGALLRLLSTKPTIGENL